MGTIITVITFLTKICQSPYLVKIFKWYNDPLIVHSTLNTLACHYFVSKYFRDIIFRSISKKFFDIPNFISLPKVINLV